MQAIGIERKMLVEELRRVCAERKLVDVRSASEFAGGHIPGAVNIPMEQLESRIADLAGGRLVLVCQAGQRARICGGLLRARGLDSQVLEGGTNAWLAAGMPVVRTTATRWSIERQVRLGAGLLGLSGALLAVWVSPAWVWLAAFIGAGLTFAGATGICAMGNLLGRMPWNRARICEVK